MAAGEQQAVEAFDTQLPPGKRGLKRRIEPHLLIGPPCVRKLAARDWIAERRNLLLTGRPAAAAPLGSSTSAAQAKISGKRARRPDSSSARPRQQGERQRGARQWLRACA